jgi:glucose-6-phosphate isomerase
MEVEPGATSGDYLSGFFQGTRRALYENGRESMTITVDRCDARTIGVLIALYERAVGFYATLVNINAYHQPGVEAGKKAATAVLQLQGIVLSSLRERAGQEMNAEEVAALLGIPDETETVFHILCHAAANPAHGIEMVREVEFCGSRFLAAAPCGKP